MKNIGFSPDSHHFNDTAALPRAALHAAVVAADTVVDGATVGILVSSASSSVAIAVEYEALTPVPTACAVIALITEVRLAEPLDPKNEDEVAVRLESRTVVKNASRYCWLAMSSLQYVAASCEMAVCCEATNASICGAGGSDCCSELYCMFTAVSEVGTPVMVESVALISAKLRTPMSGASGLSFGAGGMSGEVSVNTCVKEPN